MPRSGDIRAVLTSLDGDGVAIVGAVQLPAEAQTAFRERQVVLLDGLRSNHH